VYQSKEAARIDQETDGKYVHKEQTVLLQLSSDGAQGFTFATQGHADIRTGTRAAYMVTIVGSQTQNSKEWRTHHSHQRFWTRLQVSCFVARSEL
jgi:hypothetical protein